MKLRRLRITDLQQTFDWRNDHDVWKWCRQNEPLHQLRHETWFQRQSDDNSMSMFGIEVATTLVGVCGLTSIDRTNQSAEFSCYIAPKERGRGLAKEALQGLFSHGFDNLNLNHIYGETFDGNPAARLFERLGMKKEGTRRQFYFREGLHVDAHIYSILLSEYLEQPWKSSYRW
jgi:ribosomal-protein-alanine N-acetyltransferase